MTIESYGKIYALGNKGTENILDGNIVIQEKVDGSQFSFGKIDGSLFCRSKGKNIDLDNPEKMFAAAVNFVKSIADILHPCFIYRGEYLANNKHNVLKYDRIPKNHIILFDIEDTTVKGSIPKFLDREFLELEADRIGLEVVSEYYRGEFDDSGADLMQFLNNTSSLGRCKIEGIVIKNYNKITKDDKVLRAKIVSSKFKEIRGESIKKNNSNDIIENIVTMYKLNSRRNKAVQHLRESGNLDESAKDIGNIIKEIQSDLKEEESEEIKEMLFKWAWPKIARGVVSGVPEWYKEKLLKDMIGE